LDFRHPLPGKTAEKTPENDSAKKSENFDTKWQPAAPNERKRKKRLENRANRAGLGTTAPRQDPPFLASRGDVVGTGDKKK